MLRESWSRQRKHVWAAQLKGGLNREQAGLTQIMLIYIHNIFWKLISIEVTIKKKGCFPHPHHLK